MATKKNEAVQSSVKLDDRTNWDNLVDNVQAFWNDTVMENQVLFAVGTAIILILAVVLYGAIGGDSEAPDFTLKYTDGNTFSLSDYEGEKVLVVEFMNMNCGTCKNFESNTMKSYCNESMPEDVEVISVTQTKNADESELAERTEEMGWRFMKGSGEMTDAFGADRSPTIVIIDKDGMITFSESGPMSQSELENEVNAALG